MTVTGILYQYSASDLQFKKIFDTKFTANPGHIGRTQLANVGLPVAEHQHGKHLASLCVSAGQCGAPQDSSYLAFQTPELHHFDRTGDGGGTSDLESGLAVDEFFLRRAFQSQSEIYYRGDWIPFRN
jgi:hypothetical protein